MKICVIRQDNRHYERYIDMLLRVIRKAFFKVKSEKTNNNEYVVLVPFYKEYKGIVKYLIQK
ncbi:MAG: hypothetical protein K6B70_00505, partial [Clostridia bacterium]|nr:hypothetical protein [Clostridia bacterium]